MSTESIKVVILCGGMGTRLREETEYRPKPMVEIGGKPLIWHIMNIYSAYGYKDFILCLGHKGEQIKRYFYNFTIWNNDFTVDLGTHNTLFPNSREEEDWRVTLADTGEATLKGARIKRIEKYIEGNRFMLTYGDGVADIDIAKLLWFHRNHGRIGTVTAVMQPSRFGELTIRKDIVLSFTEKPQVSEGGLINGGFFVFNREIFDYLSEDETCDLEVGPLEQLAQDGELMVYKHKGHWGCVDTLRDMGTLNNLWRTGKAFWKKGRD